MQWYIVQALSGTENKVANVIQQRANREGLSQYIEEILVPSHTVEQVKGSRKQTLHKNDYPGYIFIKMQVTDDLWYMIKNVSNVVGFLGGSGKPNPVPESQVKDVLSRLEEGVHAADLAAVFEIGESIKVIDGPFESFTGVVEEIEQEKQKLKVAVSIFGRSTPVELDYTQVEKVDG